MIALRQIKEDSMRFTLLVFLLFSSQSIFALDFEVKIAEGRIQIQKYDLWGRAVFSNNERDQIIKDAVDTGTGTPKLSDFVLVNISTHILEIVKELNDEGMVSSRSQAIKDIKIRMSREYNLKKLAEKRVLLNSYRALSSDGQTIDNQDKQLEKEIENHKARFRNPLP